MWGLLEDWWSLNNPSVFGAGAESTSPKVEAKKLDKIFNGSPLGELAAKPTEGFFLKSDESWIKLSLPLLQGEVIAEAIGGDKGSSQRIE